MSYEEVRKRFNFKELNVATWRNPYESVHPARRGPGLLTTISPADAAKPYIPTYKYQIKPPPKLPEPTDDEDSGSEDEQDDDDGATEDQPAVEAVPAPPDLDLAALLQQPPAIIPGDPPPISEPDVPPILAEEPADVTSTKKEDEPVIEAGVPSATPDPPVIADVPDDPVPASGEESIVPEEHAATPDALSQEEEPAKDNVVLGTDLADGRPATEVEPQPQPATESEQTEATDLEGTSQAPGEVVPDASSGNGVNLEVPPPAPEPPIELDRDIPPPPPSGLDDVMAALGLAPAEMVKILDLPPPPGPEPPSSMEAEVPTNSHHDDVLVEPTGDAEEHPDKKVSFAPGTPEPKPTHRKKKSATGTKKKKKRSTLAESEGRPDDIVAIIDESEQPSVGPPPPVESYQRTDSVVEVQEPLAASVVEPLETKEEVQPDAKPQEQSVPVSHLVDVPIPEATTDASVASAAPPSKHSSRNPAKSSSKDKGTSKKSSKSKGKKTASEQGPTGLGIEMVPDIVPDIPAVEGAAPSSDTKEAVDVIPHLRVPAGNSSPDDALQLAPNGPAKAEVQREQTDTPDATTEPDLPPGKSTQQAGEIEEQSVPGVEAALEPAISDPALSEGIDEHTDPEPPPEGVTDGLDSTQADDTSAAEEPRLADNDGIAEANPGQDVEEIETQAPTLEVDPNELQVTGSHEADTDVPSTGGPETAGMEDFDDSAGGHEDRPDPAAQSEVSSLDPDNDVVAPEDDAFEEDDAVEAGAESAKEEDVSSDNTTEEPELADSVAKVEETTRSISGAAEELLADEDSLSDDIAAPAGSDHAGEEDVVVDELGANTNELAAEIAETPESTDDKDDADGEKGDAAVEEDARATASVGAPAEGVPDVTVMPDTADLSPAHADPDAAEEEAHATEVIDKPEEDQLPAEDEEANTTGDIADEGPVDSDAHLGAETTTLDEAEASESVVQDDEPEVGGANSLEAVSTSAVPQAPEDPDTAGLGEGEAGPEVTEDEKIQDTEPHDSASAVLNGASPIEVESADADATALPAEIVTAPVPEQTTGDEEPSSKNAVTEEAAPTVEITAPKTVDEAPAVPKEDVASPDTMPLADTPENAAANGPPEPLAVVTTEVVTADAELPPEEPEEKTPSSLADADVEAKDEAVTGDVREVDSIQEASVEPPCDPAPTDPGTEAEVNGDQAPEPEAQIAADELPSTGDAVQANTEKEIKDDSKASEASPEAPPSPTMSKDSTKRRMDDRRHSSKKSNSDTRSGDKRSRRASTSGPKGRTDRHRSGRLSMTAEEAERRERREARAAQKAEEAARLAAQVKRKADEQAERQLRHDARRAAKKAAVQEAEEVARRIAREEAEAEAKLAAEARRRRRERRDSAVEKERPRDRYDDRDRDRERERDRQRRSERLRDTDRRYEDSKPARPPLLKAFTIGTGESSTRAGLLIRTSSDGKTVRDSSKRSSARESKPRHLPKFEDRVSQSERKTGSDRGSHRSQRSGEVNGESKASDEPRTASKDSPRTASRDPPVLKRASTDRPHRRRRESTITDEQERDRDRPHRSRRESERRERRPTLDDKSKEKKSSFMGSLLKAFR